VKITIADLQQLDGNSFQPIPLIVLIVSADVHAQVIFLVRRFPDFRDACVPLYIGTGPTLLLRRTFATFGVKSCSLQSATPRPVARPVTAPFFGT
jgi:hypothetical protein